MIFSTLPAKPSPSRYALLAVSALGALFCLLNATGSELFCVTQGCKIYADYGLFGISFYFYGLAAFLLVFFLALLHPRYPVRFPALLVLALALFFDTLFLFYQYLFWPCVSCLVVAALLGLTALLGFWYFGVARRSFFSGLYILWALFFLFAGLTASRDLLFKPWAIHGATDAPVQVYFSPFCPACRDAVFKILDSPQASRAAFYPIAKSARDEAHLARFLQLRAEGTDPQTALEAIFDQPESSMAPLSMRTRLHLLANKMVLARMGATTVPQIVSPFVLESRPRLQLAPSLFEPLLTPPAPPQIGCGMFEESPDCD